jgi:3-phenylpropionate/trans-cinnamate dioxygenase ferredoxin reductase subunit
VSARVVATADVGIGNAVAKDIRLAEMLIGARAAPEVADLADPSVPLKSLLYGSRDGTATRPTPAA